MPQYTSPEQLKQTMETLFDQVARDPEAVKALQTSRLIIRMRLLSPAMDVTLNGRKSPYETIYGPTALHPDLHIEMSAEVFHGILQGEPSLSKAFKSGQLVFRGPFWKLPQLEIILKRAQAAYPAVLRNGTKPG
jgi:hypothetical protein